MAIKNKYSVRVNLDEILKEKGISKYRIERETGLAPMTIHNIYKNEVSQIHFSTIAALCEALEITPGDLISIVPAQKKKSKSE